MTAPASAPVQTFEQKVAERRLLLATKPAEIVDERGYPVPPQEVVRRLPHGASIKWIPAAGFYGTAYFALMKNWDENDPRWARVRSGECAPENARDIVQMFPRECPPEQMAAYVEHRWGRRNTPADARAEAARLIAEAERLTKQAEEENINLAVEHSNERSARETNHSLELRAGQGTANAQITVPVQVDGPKRLM